MKKGAKYHIKWHDTLGIDEWCNWKRIEETAKICAENQWSVGFYVGDAHNYHIFAATINNSPGMLPYANVVMIPRGCVTKVKKL